MVPATLATWPIAYPALSVMFIIAHNAQLIISYQMELAYLIVNARRTVLHALLRHVINVSLVLYKVLQMHLLALRVRQPIA